MIPESDSKLAVAEMEYSPVSPLVSVLLWVSVSQSASVLASVLASMLKLVWASS